MKRIALIMHGGIAPPGWDVPAITGLVQDLSAKFDITVYTGLTPGGPQKPLKCGAAEVRYLPYRHGVAPARFVLLAVLAFRKDHSALPFSLVHGFWGLPGGLAAVLAGRLAGIPSVVSLLGGEAASLPEIRYGNMRTPLSRILTLLAARSAGDLVVLTGYQLDQLRRFGFARTERVHVIPLGADPSAFPYVAERPAAPPYHLLHVGHLNRVKDQRTLLEAFWQIRGRLDCYLRIIGEGALDGELRTLADELGVSDRVSFAGFVPHDRLGPHYAWAHLLLHSSRYEGEGVVFTEAAASGVPVCGTRVGLLAEPEFSFAATVDPGDPGGLAEAACSVLNDGVRRESLRDRARAWAGQHTAQWSASRYADLYLSRINGRTIAVVDRAGVEDRRIANIVHDSSHMEFVCPSCHRALVAGPEGWRCEEEQILFQTEEGIPSFLLPKTRGELQAFLKTYQQVRNAEGWGEASTRNLAELPYRDFGGKHAKIWRIRARTYDRFLLHFSREVRDRRVRLLDIGAGNCWFAARVAALEHSVVALDINLDPFDGLGALGRFPREQATRVVPVRADFDAPPFCPETFDVAVFNASLHYSPDVTGTISRTMDLLKKGGVLYVLDTPVYRNPQAGAEMVLERKKNFASMFTALPDDRTGSFLTHAMLRDLGRTYRMEVITPRYGIRWELRPFAARMLGKREPASFMILALHKD